MRNLVRNWIKLSEMWKCTVCRDLVGSVSKTNIITNIEPVYDTSDTIFSDIREKGIFEWMKEQYNKSVERDKYRLLMHSPVCQGTFIIKKH